MRNTRIPRTNGNGGKGFEEGRILTEVNRYAAYQKEPEEPYVGSPHYPAKIYNSWDPNWRGFVGTTLIMAIEEYPSIISKPTQKLILQSLYNTTKGDEYRFGNTDNTKDNLYPAYSNPVSGRTTQIRTVLTFSSQSCVPSCQDGLVVASTKRT